jgi:type IV pilus assembly protein PilQ
MNIKKIKTFCYFLALVIALTGCAADGNHRWGKKSKPFKHNAPLIKGNIREAGKTEIAKTIEMGPKPVFGDSTKLKKRKTISSSTSKNYLLIPKEFTSLKQRITLKFQNLDFRETMKLMGKIGEINILVGDEVAGEISAELVDVPWDTAFQALLDIKNYASDIDVSSNLIRIHSPSLLTSQDNYKKSRAGAIKNRVELEDSIIPTLSEIFRLYYITPTQAKKTLTELFAGQNGGSSAIQITEDQTTRSLIIRGKEKDLDVVNKVIKEIDVRTKQVLIEAFIVEANSDFEKALGARLGGYYSRQGKVLGGLGSSGSSGSAQGADLDKAAGLGSSNDAFGNFSAAGATSGIGLLKRTTAGVLKLEITALEAMGLGKTISNPKVFTLDNMMAKVTQGQQIPYKTAGEGGFTTSFKDAALVLEVTPSIIGDGNVLLDIKVNNDSAQVSAEGEPPINKMEIITKLLIADGDIVVIGGIKKNVQSESKSQAPGMGDVPVIGNLFKSKAKSDSLNELLVFIAARVL